MYKVTTALFIITFIAWIQACQSDHDRIKGHWHEVNPEDKEKIYHTWDITDSTIVMNEADSPFADTTSYSMNNGKLFWGEVEDDIKFAYTSIHDTLILQRDSVDYKTYLVKRYNCTPKEHFFHSSYLDIQLNIDLPSSSQTGDIDRDRYNLANIFIGKRKSFPDNKSGDSICIQVNDVFIDYGIIPDFLEENNHIHSPRLTPALYIDKNTPMYIVDRVKYEIARSGSKFSVVHFMSIKDSFQLNFYQGIGMLLPPSCQHKAKYYRQPLPDPDISFGYLSDGISKSTYCSNEAILNNLIPNYLPHKIFAIQIDSLNNFYFQKFDASQEYKQTFLKDNFEWKNVAGQKLTTLVENFILDNRKNYLVSLQYDGQTDYDTYIQMQSILSNALYELRDEYALLHFHKPYNTLTENEAKQVYTFYPKRMIEISEDELLYLKEDL
ncbi:hypothetical protein GXP67_30025 [Rhodocytophaga rosea]|uniref:Uncharacterized protein n=1 Tax=Rhodocytophaga rosea TaxID=2704465 RepID=A0A6C0GSZ0_9BACT|nr:hypothetical protein [Rhodocytophaga rosea]QHT70590.1 hypothetical protein GXP67_30025 [Rhodocytophaga rosea]